MKRRRRRRQTKRKFSETFLADIGNRVLCPLTLVHEAVPYIVRAYRSICKERQPLVVPSLAYETEDWTASSCVVQV